MTRVWLVLLTLWFAMTIPAAAQETPRPITAVGCVNRAVTDGSLTGSPGVPAATPNTAPTLANTAEPTGALVLNNAEIAGETPQARRTRTTPRSFQLDEAGSDLERHIGHQVEVAGTLRTVAVSGLGAQTTTVEHIVVSTVRMVSTACKAPEPR